MSMIKVWSVIRSSWGTKDTIPNRPFSHVYLREEDARNSLKKWRTFYSLIECEVIKDEEDDLVVKTEEGYERVSVASYYNLYV